MAVCVVIVVAPGCSKPYAGPVWTPTTKYLDPITPLASNTWTAASADAALYQQAMDVYDQFFQLDGDLQAQGGADQLPPDLAALLTDSALTKETQVHRNAKAAGAYWVGTPHFQTDKVAQLMTGLPPNTDIALQACETTSGAELWDASGKQLADGSPGMVLANYYMRFNVQHTLVIFNLISAGRIDTCPI